MKHGEFEAAYLLENYKEVQKFILHCDKALHIMLILIIFEISEPPKGLTSTWVTTSRPSHSRFVPSTIPIALFELNCFLEAQFLLLFNFTMTGRDRSADVPDHQHLLQVAFRVSIVLAN